MVYKALKTSCLSSSSSSSTNLLIVVVAISSSHPIHLPDSSLFPSPSFLSPLPPPPPPFPSPFPLPSPSPHPNLSHGLTLLQSHDRLGRRGDMKDDSAEILFQSFLQEALVSSSGMGRDVHSLMLSIQHFFCRTPRRPPSKVPWRMVLERLS